HLLSCIVTAPPRVYTLSLHDALPIWGPAVADTKTETTVLPDPCWFRPAVVGETYHYRSREAALAADDPRDDEWVPPVVARLGEPCVIVVCACCCRGCDEPGECVVYHASSEGEAVKAALEAGWAQTVAGWVCEPCRCGDCGWHS